MTDLTTDQKAAKYDQIVEECQAFKRHTRAVDNDILFTRMMSVMVGRVLHIVGLGRKSYQPKWPSE